MYEINGRAKSTNSIDLTQNGNCFDFQKAVVCADVATATLTAMDYIVPVV